MEVAVISADAVPEAPKDGRNATAEAPRAGGACLRRFAEKWMQNESVKKQQRLSRHAQMSGIGGYHGY